MSEALLSEVWDDSEVAAAAGLDEEATQKLAMMTEDDVAPDQEDDEVIIVEHRPASSCEQQSKQQELVFPQGGAEQNQNSFEDALDSSPQDQRQHRTQRVNRNHSTDAAIVPGKLTRRDELSCAQNVEPNSYLLTGVQDNNANQGENHLVNDSEPSLKSSSSNSSRNGSGKISKRAQLTEAAQDSGNAVSGTARNAANGFDKVMLSLLSISDTDVVLTEFFEEFEGLEPLQACGEEHVNWEDSCCDTGSEHSNHNNNSSNGQHHCIHQLNQHNEASLHKQLATTGSSNGRNSSSCSNSPRQSLHSHKHRQTSRNRGHISQTVQDCSSNQLLDSGTFDVEPSSKMPSSDPARMPPSPPKAPALDDDIFGMYGEEDYDHKNQEHDQAPVYIKSEPLDIQETSRITTLPPNPPSVLKYESEAFQTDFGDFDDSDSSIFGSSTDEPTASHSSRSLSPPFAPGDFSINHSDAHENAMGMENGTLYGSFDEHLFVDRYQRNNKCSGLKNLRCFPNCGPTHQPRKFCGQGITFHAVYKPEFQNDEYASKPNFIAYGRFDTASGRFKDVEIGTEIPLDTIRTSERKRGRPLAPWYPSYQDSAKSGDASYLIDFKFNSKEHQGWHYDWVATKYTCDTLHVFNVYIFTIDEDKNTLQCVGKFSSPAFQLYCRRRQRFRRMAPVTKSSPATLLYHIAVLLQKAQDPAVEDSDVESPSSPQSIDEASISSKTQQLSPQEKYRRLQRILRRLAHHVVSESAFTDHITNVCQDIAYRRDRGESIDLGFNRFLEAIRQYLHDYLQENGSTLTEIEELYTAAADIIKSSQNNVQTSDVGVFGLVHPSASISSAAPPAPEVAASMSTQPSVVRDDDAGERSFDQRKYGTAPLKDAKNPERRVRQVFLNLIDAFSTQANRIKRPRRVEPHVLEGLEGLSKRLRIELYSPSDSATVLGSPRETSIECAVRLPKADLDKYYQYDPSQPWIGFDPNGKPDVSGIWAPEAYSALRLQQLRVGTMKMPWMRSKMLSSMERELSLQHTPTTLSIQLRRKLLSDGFIDYVFDGKEHPFDLRDPLMCVATPMALTKQAFTVGNAVVIRHRYSEVSRYTRLWWRSPTNNALLGRGILEFRASMESPWSIHSMLVADAHAVTSPDPQFINSHELVDLPPSPALLQL